MTSPLSRVLHEWEIGAGDGIVAWRLKRHDEPRRAAGLATRVTFSNSATAPSTWRTRTAVVSTKNVGAVAAMSVI